MRPPKQMKFSLYSETWMLRFNYILFAIILLAVIISFIVAILNITYYHNIKTYNTWQFPMLLALLADQFVYLFL